MFQIISYHEYLLAESDKNFQAAVNKLHDRKLNSRTSSSGSE
jgi:hypothetical protein